MMNDVVSAHTSILGSRFGSESRIDKDGSVRTADRWGIFGDLWRARWRMYFHPIPQLANAEQAINLTEPAPENDQV